MKILLFVLLLALFLAATCATEILTNPTVELGANRQTPLNRNITNILSRVLTEIKALRKDVKAAIPDNSLPLFCSPPFIKEDSMCLFAVCREQSWSVARETCAAKGGDVIWLQDSKEHLLANGFFARSCPSSSLYWTSLRRRYHNGQFVWGGVNGKSYTNARVINTNRLSFASVANTTTLVGQASTTNLKFICRQVPKVEKDVFRPMKLKEIDIGAFGVSVGQRDMASCSDACISRGPNCVAFHRSSSGVCFIIKEKNTELWKMKTGVPSSFYFVRSENLASSCTFATFPFSHGASRYRFVAEKRTWQQSRATCESMGGRLAELPTEAERVLIKGDAKSISGFSDDGRRAYIGLVQIPGSKEPADGWMWYRSRLPVTGGWGKGEPNNDSRGKSEDFGMMYFPAGDLNDVLSGLKLFSICECSIIG